jgi:transcriptional/translational regulatory protein YebC/TACO1
MIALPKQTLQQAIDKGSQSKDEKWENVVYEARAGNGVMLVIDSLTNNRNRTGPKLRSILKRYVCNNHVLY